MPKFFYTVGLINIVFIIATAFVIVSYPPNTMSKLLLMACVLITLTLGWSNVGLIAYQIGQNKIPKRDQRPKVDISESRIIYRQKIKKGLMFGLLITTILGIRLFT